MRLTATMMNHVMESPLYRTQNTVNAVSIIESQSKFPWNRSFLQFCQNLY